MPGPVEPAAPANGDVVVISVATVATASVLMAFRLPPTTPGLSVVEIPLPEAVFNAAADDKARARQKIRSAAIAADLDGQVTGC